MCNDTIGPREEIRPSETPPENRLRLKGTIKVGRATQRRTEEKEVGSVWGVGI